jgi:hypothetical protein
MRKSDQHATCFPRLIRVWHSTIRILHGPRMTTFCESSTALDRVTALEKKSSRHNPQHAGWPIHESVSSFSPEPTNCRQQATRLTGLISTTCDRYVQYMLTGGNPSVLNRHRRGLQPWRCRISTYHSLTFPTSDLHFPPKGPARSQIIHSTINNGAKVKQTLNLVSGSPHSTSTRI